MEEERRGEIEGDRKREREKRIKREERWGDDVSIDRQEKEDGNI